MSACPSTDSQLGFDTLLQSAETDNRMRRIERETAHLPGDMAEALLYFRLLLRRHHAAMLDANVDETMRLREEAGKLALKLNGGDPGIIARPDAPGCVLERETAAATGDVPRWGQTGGRMLRKARSALQHFLLDENEGFLVFADIGGGLFGHASETSTAACDEHARLARGTAWHRRATRALSAEASAGLKQGGPNDRYAQE